MKYVVGLAWTKYSPGLEGQILRDLIAVQQDMGSGNRPMDLIIYAPDNSADSCIKAMGATRTDYETLAQAWIVYQTEDEMPELPPDAQNVVERDLRHKVKEFQIDPNERNGFFLKPQGWTGNNRINQIAPGRGGTCDPLVILLWG